MDIARYRIVITRHAFDQAIARSIHPDLIEDIILKGKMYRFGRRYVKFINKGSKRTIICVGELTGTRIKIFTVEDEK